MGKSQRTTPEEQARQEANQRRFQAMIDRRLAEERRAAEEAQKPRRATS